MYFFAGNIQIVVEHFLVESHLQGVAFLRAQLAAPFLGLARLQFYQVASVALQEVHASLQAETFAQEGRFEHRAVLVDVAVGRGERLFHRVVYVVKLLGGAGEIGRVDVGARAIFHHVRAEGFLYGALEGGGRVGPFVHTVVQKLVGGVTQQGVVAGFARSELVDQILQRAVPVVGVAGRQRADVNQVVRFEHHDFGAEHPGLVAAHGEQVELCACIEHVAQGAERLRADDGKRRVGRMGLVVGVDVALVPVCHGHPHPFPHLAVVGAFGQGAPTAGQATLQFFRHRDRRLRADPLA